MDKGKISGEELENVLSDPQVKTVPGVVDNLNKARIFYSSTGQLIESELQKERPLQAFSLLKHVKKEDQNLYRQHIDLKIKEMNSTGKQRDIVKGLFRGNYLQKLHEIKDLRLSHPILDKEINHWQQEKIRLSEFMIMDEVMEFRSEVRNFFRQSYRNPKNFEDMAPYLKSLFVSGQTQLGVLINKAVIEKYMQTEPYNTLFTDFTLFKYSHVVVDPSDDVISENFCGMALLLLVLGLEVENKATEEQFMQIKNYLAELEEKSDILDVSTPEAIASSADLAVIKKTIQGISEHYHL